MMASEYPTFPDDETLKQGLAHLLHCDSLEIVHRRPTENPRTFQSELIHCRLETGVTKQLLIKYSGDREHDGLDHRRGVEYEAGVYRNVIRPSGAPTVEFYGSCEDPKTGWTWLVIQHLEKASTINHFPELLKAAAHWIGAFHRATQPLAVNRNLGLRRWECAHYHVWAQRTEQLADYAPDTAKPGISRYTALSSFAQPLLETVMTVAHGEFYPLNVLACEGAVFPIDWESAAIGAGEIDLAALTDGWSFDVVQSCKQAYRDSRWAEGEPPQFESTFVATQIYWHLRWLGHNPEWTARRGIRWRWHELAKCLDTQDSIAKN